ncbi:MAG: isochorismatase family protein [Fodinibius sp.]|nr:isochorismatase family protein [Fodinibius sp.]
MNALLIVDVQNDFCPGGALEVPDGDTIVPVINNLATRFDVVVQTQDWHPAGRSSFASSHDGKAPFETTEIDVRHSGALARSLRAGQRGGSIPSRPGNQSLTADYTQRISP